MALRLRSAKGWRPERGGDDDGGDRIAAPVGAWHTLQLLVENRPGVLARVAQVLSFRGINVEFLTLTRLADDASLAQMSLTFATDARGCDLICRKFGKLIDVLDVEEVRHSSRVP